MTSTYTDVASVPSSSPSTHDPSSSSLIVESVSLPITSNSLPDVATATHSKPEMGLPVETWLHIIKFLARDPFSLMACALTCRGFRGPAQDMINYLMSPYIDIASYHDINLLAAEILGSPGHNKCAHTLNITANGAPVALSVIPHRLAGQFVNLSSLWLDNILVGTHSHPSTWTLYGRAFPSVTGLYLQNIQFHSFLDVSSLLTSFPALNALALISVSCGDHEIPMSVARNPKKHKFHLQSIRFWNSGIKDGGWFVTTFIWWFLPRMFPPPTIFIDGSVTTSLSGYRFLRAIRKSVQNLCIHHGDVPETKAGERLRRSMGEQALSGLYVLSSMIVF